ncbi:DNA cytosine methyltransferase [Streptomyces sp. NBC_00198]|uniref:DNA cytosine methyltransferase n=1 Tax=Streptomyces sp. NBC_00198 TaxID=2975677 RepID=UPI002256CEE1|nr:DNA (cytosine-5-)-methyltransferase [Streptomyces sp. NBC_00198]MCX5279113.1 DNA (cytosine-5-)-methyltransferase [Streptomyces sp. NBC_00198]
MPERPKQQHSLFEATTHTAEAEGPVVPSRIRSTSPFHQPRDLTEAQREKYRQMSRESREARRSALAGEGPAPLHEINVPNFRPLDLMPQRDGKGLRALSLFSGGGGLDLGIERAGFAHTASFEIMPEAGDTLRKARSDWAVFSGEAEGDVRNVNFKQWRGEVDLLHGGPPCQPFSNAGRQQGHLDERDMWPQFVRAVKEIRPAAFIGENVPALASPKFSEYVSTSIMAPLSGSYHIQKVILQASDFGVPQVRRRVFFVGFRTKKSANAWHAPEPTHYWGDASITAGTRCMGLREALGLPEIGIDDLSPTIRSSLTGPRHTTSILNSVAAQRKFESLQIWPNGVAADRASARSFVAKNGHFRLSVPDVALIQGFPEDWPFVGATYMTLGQIGNAVPPPLAYAVGSSVLDVLSK